MAEVIAAQNRSGCEISNATTIHPGKLPRAADGVHDSPNGDVTLGKLTASVLEEHYKQSLLRHDSDNTKR